MDRSWACPFLKRVSFIVWQEGGGGGELQQVRHIRISPDRKCGHVKCSVFGPRVLCCRLVCNVARKSDEWLLHLWFSYTYQFTVVLCDEQSYYDSTKQEV